MKIIALKTSRKIIKHNDFFNKINQYKKQILITIFLTVISLLFIFNSSKYLPIVLNGILLYGTKVLPSLLPFLFITKLLSNFDVIYSVCNKFSSITKFLFNTKSISCYIFFMSIISGYPVGAKLVSEFYNKKIINETDAQKILSFCSTSGPLFIIGTVGVGFLKSEKLGILIFLIHIISSILNGILYRNLGNKITQNFTLKNTNKNKEDDENEIVKINTEQDNIKNFSLSECMYSTINSVLMVGGFIIIFYVLINILLDFNLLYPFIKLFEIFGLSNLEATGFISGIIEITTGISILAQSQNIGLVFILSNALISFSGISILMQSNAFLEQTGVNKLFYLLQKITHATISLILSVFVVILFF